MLRAIDDARDAQRIAPLVVLRENVSPWMLHVRLPVLTAAAPLGVRVTAEDGAACDDAAVARRAARSADARGRGSTSASRSR